MVNDCGFGPPGGAPPPPPLGNNDPQPAANAIPVNSKERLVPERKRTSWETVFGLPRWSLEPAHVSQKGTERWKPRISGGCRPATWPILRFFRSTRGRGDRPPPPPR